MKLKGDHPVARIDETGHGRKESRTAVVRGEMGSRS